LFWLFTIWMILRLTSAYIDLAAASQLPIWKLFVSTLPYGALGITGIAMPLACWLVTPSRSFDHLFRSTMARSLEFGALLIAAAAAIESIYRPDLIHLWFHI
jgi:hypothetical protein